MGSAAVHNGFFVFDRIETHPSHRRKGLARAVMHALDGFNVSEARPVLVATTEGRRLYDQLGWTAISPYSTAFIPFRSPSGIEDGRQASCEPCSRIRNL
jgi:GNAT superfamily N-acetyltransferase